jgi:hypothetical protein
MGCHASTSSLMYADATRTNVLRSIEAGKTRNLGLLKAGRASTACGRGQTRVEPTDGDRRP